MKHSLFPWTTVSEAYDSRSVFSPWTGFVADLAAREVIVDTNSANFRS